MGEFLACGRAKAMQARQESEFICKVTTDSKKAGLFNSYAEFMTQAYSYIGCTMFVEPFEGGAIVFYKTTEDFKKFQNFAAQLVPIYVVPPESPKNKLKTLKLAIEFVKKPNDISMDQLAKIMEKSHRILSPDISVEIKPPASIILKYKSPETFDTIFKKIWETLGKKAEEITWSLR